MTFQPLLHQEHATTFCGIEPVKRSVLGKCPATLVRKRMRSSDTLVQFSAEKQHRIANLLGRQSSTVETPQQSRFRVALARPLVELARSPVSRRVHDQPVQRLDRKPRLAKTRGQPVEQLRVGWAFSANAEIVLGRHQPTTEMTCPDPVGHHPRHQWVVFTSQPARQFQSTATAGLCERFTAENLEIPSRHHRSQFRLVTA